MAKSRSNTSVAEALYVGEGTVSKHFGSVLTKLDLNISDATNRRVLAVLAFLRGCPSHSPHARAHAPRA